MDSNSLRSLITLIIIVLTLIVLFARFCIKNHDLSIKFISRTGIFSAISVLLYIVPYFHFSLPFFPAFLEIHLDEIPALIAGFAYGPFTGFIIVLIKTIVKLPMSTTMCVGELCDLLYSSIFVVLASFIYMKKRTIKGAFISLIISTMFQLAVSSFMTSFVILNFYMNVVGLSRELILAMCQAVNPAVTDLGFTFLLMVALPFNALKDLLVIVFTLLLYKKLHRLIDKIGAQKN